MFYTKIMGYTISLKVCPKTSDIDIVQYWKKTWFQIAFFFFSLHHLVRFGASCLSDSNDPARIESLLDAMYLSLEVETFGSTNLGLIALIPQKK